MFFDTDETSMVCRTQNSMNIPSMRVTGYRSTDFFSAIYDWNTIYSHEKLYGK